MVDLLRVVAVALAISIIVPHARADAPAASPATSQAVGVGKAIGEKWFSLLKDLVETNSGTDNVAGIEEVRKKLIPEFEKLGYHASITDFGNGHKLVAFDWPSHQSSGHNNDHPKVLLTGHLDTFFPKTSAFQKLTESPTELHGPGVMDMKGGVVMILNLLTDLDEDSRRQIRIVLNDDEEVGSPNSKNKTDELAANIPYGLVFEPGLPNGDVIISHSVEERSDREHRNDRRWNETQCGL
jgi:glutamate carboxypeptidase